MKVLLNKELKSLDLLLNNLHNQLLRLQLSLIYQMNLLPKLPMTLKYNMFQVQVTLHLKLIAKLLKGHSI